MINEVEIFQDEIKHSERQRKLNENSRNERIIGSQLKSEAEESENNITIVV